MTLSQFDYSHIEKLNEQQREAVRTVDGAVLLLAVPGSGKTTVLVTRLGYMICQLNINPRSILTMTYTVAATEEMKQRFSSMFGSGYAKDLEICTINSLSSQIIRYYSRSQGKREPFIIIENDVAVKLIGQIYQQVNGEYATESVIKDIRTGITYIKNMMLSADEIAEFENGIDKMDRIYHEYCKCLRQMQLMDFDDQMIYALTILKSYPTVLDYFQERFRYICVDESQDTSKIQHEIIRLLASKYRNIFMVGDEDQSIYGFRAAYPQALLNFKTDYPDAKILLMEQNYRSSSEIVSVANAFVSKNQFRYDKKIKPTRKSGSPINFINCNSRFTQYKYIFGVAQNCQSETAVLYRNNDSALPLIDMFDRNNIEYNCKKFDDTFFSHRIINDITDIINFAYDQYDSDTFMRIYYKFGSPITKLAATYACDKSKSSGKTILHELIHCPELKSYAKDAATELLTAIPDIQNDDALAALNRIWNSLRYSSYVKDNKLDTGKFDILCMLARYEMSTKDLLRRLGELKIIIQNHTNRSTTNLMLSTVHSSKGLEYKTIYLLDIFDGILPSKTESEIKEETDRRDYEEDRRIFYVAMTRAKDELFLFICPDKESEFKTEVSKNIPKKLIDQDDIFSSFKKELCGKTFNDRVKGKGNIIAHCDDRFLIEYPNQNFELISLEQMVRNRDKTVKYAAPSIQKSKAKYVASDITTKIKLGSRVTHNLFGEGVVISLNNGMAGIKFDKNDVIKKLSLDICLKNGILK